MLLLLGSPYVTNDLGSVAFTSDVTMTQALGHTPTTDLTVDFSSSVTMELLLEATVPAVETVIPPRHYIWVYDITGAKVDVIA